MRARSNPRPNRPQQAPSVGWREALTADCQRRAEFLASCTSNPSPLEDKPLLKAYYAAFKALPQIEKYLGGELAALPINNKMACFGARPDGSAW